MLSKHNTNSQIPQFVVIIICSLAGLSHGMLFTWVSPGIPGVVADEIFNITLEQASYFTIISPIGMILAAPLYSIILNRFGRRKAVLLIGVPQLLSWIVAAFASNIYWFYLARFLSGVGDSGVFVVLPLYICEISEPLVRVHGGNILITFITIGKFIVTAVGAYTSLIATALIGGILAFVYIALAVFLPESPYYLLICNKEGAAKKSLSLLRWREDVDVELSELKVDVARQISESGTYLDILKSDSNRKALIIAAGLRLAQQYCGVVAFDSYAMYMFQQAGGTVSAEAAATLFSFLYIPALTAVGFFGHKFGRKTSAIASSLSTAIVLTLEVVYFGIQQFSNLNITAFAWVPLTGMIAYIMTTSFGLILSPILMQGELFSASIKGKASGILTIVSGSNMIVVPKLFQLLTHNIGIFAPFALFAICAFVSTIFCCVYLIETKGKTLEQIQQELKGNKT